MNSKPSAISNTMVLIWWLLRLDKRDPAFSRDVSLDQKLVERLARQLHHDDESPVGWDATHAKEMNAVGIVYVIHRQHLLVGGGAFLLHNLAGDVLSLVMTVVDRQEEAYPT